MLKPSGIGEHNPGNCRREFRSPVSLAVAITLLLCAALAGAEPAPVSGNFEIKDFRFDDGSVMSLRQHYTTLGTPRRDENGQVTNAVLIMHGTTGRGTGFLSDRFAGVLFGRGQLLDSSEYFIILPDAIGHGGSSRPSDGMAGRFPHYTYDDMVRAQYRLLMEHLGIDHLRLVMGTSMGGMFTWVWGYSYPRFMDALMPLASLPVEIAGRNRMLRKMIIDAVKDDPEWRGGAYEEQPPGLKEAMYGLIFMVSSPLQYQLAAPTRESAEIYMEQLLARYMSGMDANDLVYAFDASRFYNPAPHLEKIRAPVFAINSADDQVNPPELGQYDAGSQHALPAYHLGPLPGARAECHRAYRGDWQHRVAQSGGPGLVCARPCGVLGSLQNHGRRFYDLGGESVGAAWRRPVLPVGSQRVLRWRACASCRCWVHCPIWDQRAARSHRRVEGGDYSG
jgi:homoserine acetyltransferase